MRRMVAAGDVDQRVEAIPLILKSYPGLHQALVAQKARSGTL